METRQTRRSRIVEVENSLYSNKKYKELHLSLMDVEITDKKDVLKDHAQI